jgi:molecular chaperone GrpE (heat shock protein)
MNLKEELDNFKEFNLDDISYRNNNSLLEGFNVLLSQVKNQTKQQFKFVQEIEYLKNEFSQKTTNEKLLVEEILKDQENIKRQNKLVIRSLIDIFDLVYSFYDVSIKISGSSLSDSAEKLFNDTKKILFNMGFIPIDKTGVSFDAEIHYVIKSESLNEYNNNSIIRILRMGFIFEGKVVRKSDVIVNKLQGS